jgi:hypothetical protein
LTQNSRKWPKKDHQNGQKMAKKRHKRSVSRSCVSSLEMRSVFFFLQVKNTIFYQYFRVFLSIFSIEKYLSAFFYFCSKQNKGKIWKKMPKTTENSVKMTQNDTKSPKK